METRNVNPTRTVVLGIAFLIILLTAIILTVYYMREKLTLSPSAKYSGNIGVSLENSYIFASPVRALAGGDLIRVTFFILDSNGLGVADKSVNLSSGQTSLIIKQVQPVTDDTGKAFFDISSSTVGTYILESSVEGVVMPQKVKVVFH